MKIKTILLALLLSTSFVGASYADPQDGSAAFKRGDYKTAFEEFKPLAEQGHSRSQFMLSTLYMFGKGVVKDDDKTFYWLTKAANNPDIISLSERAEYNFYLGYLYSKGAGVKVDKNKAFKLMLNAANNNVEAKISVASMYILGEGVRVNPALSKEWMEKYIEGGGKNVFLVKKLSGIIKKFDK